jgi:hypothetical protein
VLVLRQCGKAEIVIAHLNITERIAWSGVSEHDKVAEHATDGRHRYEGCAHRIG